MMQNKMKIEAIAKKKKVDKRKRIKKKIIAKYTCTNIKCFKYSENMCYTEAKKTDIEISSKIRLNTEFRII